jgi:uncharacterized membrane protein YdjX (TVP38/TMEM64 family)
MKRLALTALGLAATFAGTFVILKTTGTLTVADIEALLIAAHETDARLLAAAVVLLLFADMFIAVPTLTVTILSGYFLGFGPGFAAGAAGLVLAGVSGYVITHRFGQGLLQRIYRDEAALTEMSDIFNRYGAFVLVICRALPILPEVSCCLAGATRMRFSKFLFTYLLGTIPYALVASYAGSESSLANPMPAILAAIGLTCFFITAWTILIRRYRAEQAAPRP